MKTPQECLSCSWCGLDFDPHNEPWDLIEWPTAIECMDYGVEQKHPTDKEPISLCDKCGSGNSIEETAEHFELPVAHVAKEMGVEP